MPQGANSYLGLEDADLINGDRGYTEWPGAPPDGEDPESVKKVAALIRASDYLNGLHWTGRKAAGGRMMAWPRVDAVDKDGYEIDAESVPEAVRVSCAYLASLVFSGTDIQPILERGNRISSKKVDTISSSYFDDGPARDIYAFLADTLYPYCSDFDSYAGTATDAGGTGLTIAHVVI
jgi:hypothetical protein